LIIAPAITPIGIAVCMYVYLFVEISFVDFANFLACSAKLPTGLYILLALISSFFLFFYYQQSYLSIYWTDLHHLFTK